MNSLKITIPGLELDNPIIPASGTFGFGYEFSQFYDLNILGSISIKGTTLETRYGNPLPRVAETPSGMINAIGLQNPGVDAVIKEELPKLKKVYNKKVIANIGGSSLEDYIECAKKLDQEEIVGALELNVSCPNVKEGGIQFGTNCEMLSQIVQGVKKECKKPLYVKLTPNVTDVVSLAKSAELAGADGLTMINTLVGMAIDVNKRKPIISNKIGGLSGPGIKPVAIRMIYQVYSQVNIPIIGVGGIETVDDVIEMMLAGASAVQIGTANLTNPWICEEIINQLPQRLKELGYEKIEEVIGGAHE